jgi:REP element-mobilizing transposase RayT
MEFTQAGKIAEREFLGVPSHYRTVSIDSYVVMPNHVHAIIGIDGVHPYSPDQRIEEWRVDLDAISSRLPSLSSIIGGYKSAITRECHAIGLSSFAWQARFYDHLIRGNQAMAAIRNYIQNNPQNWRRGADDEHPDWNALQS